MGDRLALPDPRERARIAAVVTRQRIADGSDRIARYAESRLNRDATIRRRRAKPLQNGPDG